MKRIYLGLISLLLIIILALVPIFCAKKADALSYSIDFDTYSKSIILYNADTEMSVFEKNADMRLPVASCQKIMTFIVASENVNSLNEIVTVKNEVLRMLDGTGSSVAGLYAGEQVTITQLLYCLMVASGNDAALVLADYVGGGNVDNFVAMMNQKAKDLNLQDTHFTNPHGLHDPDNYSTARDLLTMTTYAKGLDYFNEITKTVVYQVIPQNNVNAKHTIYTTNRLINRNSDPEYYYENATGIKTGTHDEAGYCIVASATKGSYNYICVALGSPSVDENGAVVRLHGEVLDAKNLFKWAFANLSLTNVVLKDEVFVEIPIDYAWGKDKLLLCADKTYSTILPSEVLKSSIIPKITSIDGREISDVKVEAPVKRGEILGKATFSYADQELVTINLVSLESIERSELLFALSGILKIIKNPFFIAGMGAVVVIAAGYFVTVIIYRRNQRTKARVAAKLQALNENRQKREKYKMPR